MLTLKKKTAAISFFFFTGVVNFTLISSFSTKFSYFPFNIAVFVIIFSWTIGISRIYFIELKNLRAENGVTVIVNKFINHIVKRYGKYFTLVHYLEVVHAVGIFFVYRLC